MPPKYLYGPVPSRRLGLSLGIDITPHKDCTFDCIYCQLGKTLDKTIERKNYVSVDEVLAQIKDVLKSGKDVDYLTFSGSGEPTLHAQIGYLIREIKKITSIPIAVITNGSLLHRPDVQADIANADIVLPTLCAATEEVFQKINRVHPAINLTNIIQGLIDFRKSYKGKIWLEVMLLKGINDSSEEIMKLKKIIGKIQPDRIQLNTVVRPPSEKYASPLSIEELQKIKEYFGDNCEVIAEFKGKNAGQVSTGQDAAVYDLIRRRPVTTADIINALGLTENEVMSHLENLRKNKKIKLTRHGKADYFEVT